MSKKTETVLELGDLFLLKSTEKVISYSLCLYTGVHNYQRLTQTEFDEEQEEAYIYLAKAVASRLGIDVAEMKTLVIEVIHNEGDKQMLDALKEAKRGERQNAEYLGIMQEAEIIERIAKMFISDDEPTRNMASGMLIGALNDTFRNEVTA